MIGRVILLDASRGDLDGLVEFATGAAATDLTRRDLALAADGPRDLEPVASSRPTTAPGPAAAAATAPHRRLRSPLPSTTAWPPGRRP